ncbi:hypothetical protein CL614_05600 [archaeon]|nr:hypothetical protein [archaeon]
MDIAQIKNRLQQLQSTTSTSFWKPQPGKTQIRIVPYKFNKDNPFIELYFHYGMGNKTYISPVSFGRPDPINEFASKLKSTGDREEWIQGKRLEPKMRTFAPVVVRGEESDGVKFWGFGKTVYQELLGFIADPDYGDLSDPINGRDIVVERQTPAEAGNQYGKTTIRVKPNQVPLTEDKDELERIFKSQVDIVEIYTEPTYDELKEAFKTHMNPETSEDSADETVVTTPAATNTVSEVNDAFDQLFNS